MECAPRNITQIQLQKSFLKFYRIAIEWHLEPRPETEGISTFIKLSEDTWIVLETEKFGQKQKIFFVKEFLNGMSVVYHSDRTDIIVYPYTLKDIIFDNGTIKFYSNEQEITTIRKSKIFDSIRKLKYSDVPDEYEADYEDLKSLLLPFYQYKPDKCLQEYFRANRFMQKYAKENEPRKEKDYED